MYKLLIVDDEANVRTGLAALDWESMDIQVEALCENGLVALEYMLEKPADIILTDIRMPIMDGLELIERIKRSHPYAHFVALSGYNEFEYVSTCLKMGVEDYLLKPVDKNELKMTFISIVEKLNARKQQELKRQILERHARFTAKYFRKDFLRRLVKEPLSLDEIEEGCTYGEISSDTSSFLVSILRTDEYVLGKFDARDKKLILFALEQKLEGFDADHEKYYYYVNDNTGDISIILIHEELQKNPGSTAAFMNELKKLIYSLKGLVRTTISCGIGEKQGCFQNVHISAKQAEIALENKQKDNDIVFYTCLNFKENIGEPIAKEAGTARNLEDTIKSRLNAFSQKYIIESAIDFIKKNYTRAITLADVAQHVYLNPIYFSSVFKEATGMNFIHYITHCRIEEAMKLLKEPCYKVNEIGEIVGYESPRYFSIVFKKYSGMSPYEFRSSYEQ